MRPRRGVPSPSSLPAQWNTRRCIPSGSRRRIRPIARLYEVTFKEFRVSVRAIFAFAGGYKLGERYLLGELERRHGQSADPEAWKLGYQLSTERYEQAHGRRQAYGPLIARA